MECANKKEIINFNYFYCIYHKRIDKYTSCFKNDLKTDTFKKVQVGNDQENKQSEKKNTISLKLYLCTK